MLNVLYFHRPKKATHPRSVTRRTQRRCNLCHARFVPATRFSRFCSQCKMDNELFQYYETVPKLWAI